MNSCLRCHLTLMPLREFISWLVMNVVTGILWLCTAMMCLTSIYIGPFQFMVYSKLTANCPASLCLHKLLVFWPCSPASRAADSSTQLLQRSNATKAPCHNSRYVNTAQHMLWFSLIIVACYSDADLHKPSAGSCTGCDDTWAVQYAISIQGLHSCPRPRSTDND